MSRQLLIARTEHYSWNIYCAKNNANHLTEWTLINRTHLRRIFSWSEIVSREKLRREFELIDSGRRIVLDESFDLAVPIRTCFFRFFRRRRRRTVAVR